MYINASGYRFFVIKNVYLSPDIDIMSCIDMSPDVQAVVTINRLKNKDLIERYYHIFIDGSYKQSDLIRYFSIDSHLYLVFRSYCEKNLFTPIVSDRFKLSEKVLLSLNILSEVMLSDMPPTILYQLLKNKNINYDAALNIHFNYYLDLSEQNTKLTEHDIFRQFGYILKALFGKQVKQISEISAMINGCFSGSYGSYAELYLELKEFGRTVTAGGDDFSVISRFHKQREKTKEKIKSFLKVASLFVVICGIVLAILWNDRDVVRKTALVQQIGTVTIAPDTITATAGDPYAKVVNR